MVIGSGKKSYLHSSEAKLPHFARLITQSGKSRLNLIYPRQPSPVHPREKRPTSRRRQPKPIRTTSRSERPLIQSTTGQRHVLTLIKRNPFITFNEIRRSVGVALSDATIRRTFEKSGYGHWKAGKRPRLDEQKSKVRLDFALKYRDWTWDNLRKVIWSDECSVEIGKGKRDLGAASKPTARKMEKGVYTAL